MVACVRGYKVIITIPDKMSHEKINLLRAFGAEVAVCPTAVAPDDPRSYYEVAKRLHREIPNSIYPNQYFNDANPAGPLCSRPAPRCGTTPTARSPTSSWASAPAARPAGRASTSKSRTPTVKIIGVDPIGSLYHKYFHDEGARRGRPQHLSG